MKEEKKRFGKKWIIVVSVLVLVAVAVTLVVVLTPKNPNKIVEGTNEQSQTMFLKPDGQEQLFKGFQSKVTGVLKDAQKDTENVYDLATDLNKIVEFYTFPLAFVQNNKTLQNNYDNIIRSYSAAKKAQAEMVDVIVQVNTTLNVGDSSFIGGSWKEFKESFVDYFSACTRAIGSLSEIFEDCITRGVFANDFSVLVLQNVDFFLQSIEEQLKSSADATASLQATLLAPKVQCLNNFLNYLQPSSSMFDFAFDENLQRQIRQISGFENRYGTSSKAVIGSLGQSGFTFKNDQISDNEGVLQRLETFLKGELA